jgi:hypothetical protein
MKSGLIRVAKRRAKRLINAGVKAALWRRKTTYGMKADLR